MRARVLSSLDIGNCTALIPRGPHAMPQRPIAVSNIAKWCSVMAGSRSLAPWCELDAWLQYGLGDCCYPPESRGNLAAFPGENFFGGSPDQPVIPSCLWLLQDKGS